MFSVAEASAGQRAVGGDPVGGALGLVEGGLVSGGCVELAERRDYPAVFARVEMFVYAGNALFAARGIVELVIRIVGLAIVVKVGVLADVERTFRAGEEILDVCVDLLRGFEIRGIAPLRIGERVDVDDIGLDADEFLVMRLVPVAVYGILIGSAQTGSMSFCSAASVARTR